jgi:serine protease Do
VPSNIAKKIIDDLLEYGNVQEALIGFEPDYKKSKEIEGVKVKVVNEDSGAFKAGIKAGDIILEFNGVLINEMKELPKIVAQTEVGKTVEVKVWRNGKEISKKIKLGRLETSEDFKIKKPKETKDTEIDSLKINVRPIEKKDIEARGLAKNTKGLVITKIANDSLINYLEKGNIIIEAQKKVIKTIGDLEIAVSTALKSSEKTLLLVIYNNQNQRRYIGVKLN